MKKTGNDRLLQKTHSETIVTDDKRSENRSRLIHFKLTIYCMMLSSMKPTGGRLYPITYILHNGREENREGEMGKGEKREDYSNHENQRTQYKEQV